MIRSVPLVAVAHGSRDRRAELVVRSLVDDVRTRGGVPAFATFLDHAEPTPGRLLDQLASAETDEVIVLPMLLTAAYHTNTDIPAVLDGVVRRRPWLRVRYGETLGPHPALISALERRLSEAGISPGDPETAVVLAAAGSTDTNARDLVSEIGREWAERGWWAARVAYASAARPTPEEAVRELISVGAPRVAVASYLLSPGFFADQVRTSALSAGAAVVSDPLGAAPEVAGVVLDRYRGALRSPPFTGRNEEVAQPV